MNNILKGIIKTAKDLYQADSNNQLGEYIGGKVSNAIKKWDGTEAEEFENWKEQRWEELRELLNGEPFDNEFFQDAVDIWMEEFAELSVERLVAYYYKYLGWWQEFNAVGGELSASDSGDRTAEEEDALKKRQEDALSQCQENINRAIGLLDEDSEDWACTLVTAKAEILHEMDYHTEAVRLAISALPFACDEKEEEEAKRLISGKREGCDWITKHFGYGIVGIDIPKRIQLAEKWDAWTADDSQSLEDNEFMLEVWAESLTEDIEEIKHGQSTFSNRPYHDRQFIFTVRDLDHIGGCYDATDNIRYVFPLDELPGEITFPVGHPQANTLYYAHPLRPMYLPFENAQLLLFYEKVHEMCRLFQCLGATRITARCLKGAKISQDTFTYSDIRAEGGCKIMSASGEISGRSSRAESRENRDEMWLEQAFVPQKAPYCPDDLLWAKQDPELRTLIHQRLEGGLLEFTKKVSSYETSNLSQNQVNDVKAAFQSFMANVSANYSAEADSTFSQTTETEWEIAVQFKPLEAFPDYVSPQQQKAAADARKGDLIVEVTRLVYVEGKGLAVLDTLQADVKVGEPVIVCTDDSEFESSVEGISLFLKMLPEAERGDNAVLLLRGVTALNIQPGTKVYRKRGTDSVETQIVSDESPTDKSRPLTAEEEKYKEEVLFCLEEAGTITDDDRKYLERKRKKFGITEKRAREIEQEATPSLTENEKEYLETFKELAASGTLTDRAKRLLERERESLGISKERAAEIEKLMSNE